MRDLLSFYKWATVRLLALGGSCKQVFRSWLLKGGESKKEKRKEETGLQACKSHQTLRLKVPPQFGYHSSLCSTYKVVVPLNDLQEKGRPVLHRFGEDLEEVALVVVVD